MSIYSSEEVRDRVERWLASIPRRPHPHAHLSMTVVNPSVGQMRYRIDCSCGWINPHPAENKVQIWDEFLEHNQVHHAGQMPDRSCGCWK